MTHNILNTIAAVFYALAATSCTGAVAPAAQVVFALEGGSVNEAAGTMQIALRMVTPSKKDLRIPLHYSGTATSGSDFAGPEYVMIPANAQDAMFEIRLLDDSQRECPEAVTIELGATPDVIAVARRHFVIHLADNEPTGHLFTVGGKNGFAKPSDVASLVKNGDVVEFAAGEYAGDAAVWRADDLMLCGIGDGAQLRAGGEAAEGKGIWVIKGQRNHVENIHFSGARVADANGAGIRSEGSGLTIRYSSFVQNQNGILAGNQQDSTITIEHSVFRKNGAGDGLSHNIYVGKIARLNVRYCTISEAVIGHNVKSRAHETLLEYNHIMDGADGTASYLVDIPNGGGAWLIGNIIQQGPLAENSTMISFGAEGMGGAHNLLALAHNTIVNDRSAGTFVAASASTACTSINNIFAGNGEWKCAGATQSGNVTMNSGFRDRTRYDYHLQRGATAIDAGVPPGNVAGIELLPRFEYDARGGEPRRAVNGPPDAGAYEY